MNFKLICYQFQINLTWIWIHKFWIYLKCILNQFNIYFELSWYHHDNVQIHGHGPWVCPSIGLTPSVVCFWNFHRKCWWYQTLAIPISVAMAMAMSIFEYFGSCWSFFWRPSGLLGLRAVPKEVAYWSTWTWLMMSGRLKVKKICNAFLAKLGCFKAIYKIILESTKREGSNIRGLIHQK